MKTLLLIGAALAAAVVAAALVFAAAPTPDVVNRYIPMAEAFAAGDWADAFHPRFGVLFPAVTGSFVWLGCSGFVACQLAGLLFFLAAAPPLYGIFRTFCDRHTALLGAVLYLFYSHLHRVFYAGLRENVKTCALALLVWGILALCRDARSWKAALAAGAGGAMLASVRAEGFAFALCALAGLIGYDLWRRRILTGRSAAALLLFCILLTPQFYLNYRWTGRFVPFSGYLRAIPGAEARHD